MKNKENQTLRASFFWKCPFIYFLSFFLFVSGICEASTYFICFSTSFLFVAVFHIFPAPPDRVLFLRLPSPRSPQHRLVFSTEHLLFLEFSLTQAKGQPVCLGFTVFFFYRVLLAFTGLNWLLPSLTGFYLILPSFTGFYLVLLGFTGFYLVLLGFT